MSDFRDVRVGDRVTLSHEGGDTATVVATSLQFDGFNSAGGKLWRPGIAWTITVIEKAKPPLPTDEGWYSVGREGHPAERMLRLLHGKWSEFKTDGLYTAQRLAEIAAEEGRLTKLEPVAETAKRVLEAIEETYGENYLNNSNAGWNKVAAEFGVQS